MALYQRIFTVSDIAVVHRLFHDSLRLCEQIDLEARRRGGQPRALATRREILRAYGEFNDELRVLATKTAREADSRMRARLRSTQVRPDTGASPHLAALLRSRPLQRFGPVQTGEVGVADEAWLDKAINPHSPGYGPYWRAQEHGTGTPEVPSQIGRILRGYFYGTGYTDPTPPRAQYRGGGGPHPIFVSGRASKLPGSVSGGIGPRGGRGGYGTISREIQGRHFIRDGANSALADWRAGLRRVENDAISALRGVTRPRPPGRISSARRRRRP